MAVLYSILDVKPKWVYIALDKSSGHNISVLISGDTVVSITPYDKESFEITLIRSCRLTTFVNHCYFKLYEININMTN